VFGKISFADCRFWLSPFVLPMKDGNSDGLEPRRKFWFQAINQKNRKQRKEIMATKPTHEQAQLHLQVYDLRREARLRQARDWFQQNYRAETFEESMRIAPPGSENGAFVGMVIGYWEQACALLNYGLLHEDLFFETSGEFFGVWETLKPVVPQFREKMVNPKLLENLEKVAARFEAWSEERSPGHIAAMRQFVQQARGQSAAKSA
jgi:hypothetical protein